MPRRSSSVRRGARDLLHQRIPGTTTRLKVFGPYVTSGISGALLNKSDAVLQRGVWVRRGIQYGEQDEDGEDS